MSTITAQDFQLGIVQAVLFTEPDGFSVSHVLKTFFPAVVNFDADPQTLPDVGLPFPVEIPRLVLREKSGRWRCQVAPARIDLFWARVDGGTSDALPTVVAEAARTLRLYRQKTDAMVARAAVVATRFAQHGEPGLLLARHFCQERWHAAPLNRPASFELHAHKSYDLKGFTVNSWFRAKTGVMTERGTSSKVVLAEQDLNTLPRGEAMSDDEISALFALCPAELDHVLALYFPEVS